MPKPLKSQAQKASKLTKANEGLHWRIWYIGEGEFLESPQSDGNSEPLEFPTKEAAEKYILTLKGGKTHPNQFEPVEIQPRKP